LKLLSIGIIIIYQIQKKNTLTTYLKTINKFINEYGNINIYSINLHQVISFLDSISLDKKASTKRTRFATLSAFFNFITTNIDYGYINLCNTPQLKNRFKKSYTPDWEVFDKETIDELIFKTTSLRNRLILELMARGGLRIGEVLKLTPSCINGNKIILLSPKSGKDKEYAYITTKISNRLKQYIDENKIPYNERLFPISYEAARLMVIKTGKELNIFIKPHDLRRHAATYASRSGVPIEVVSKVILRHSNLSTTQRYLGKISHEEAGKWIENIFG